MFDIIGDIHGQAEKLQHLLEKLGYKKAENGYQHNEQKVIFVGDFIDRGPYQLETLKIVKEMVDNHNAYAVMGNHEFNAIGWFTSNEKKADCYLRNHSNDHYRQHHIFLDQIGGNYSLHADWIEWFKSLPLFLDFESIRIIHACWDSQVINTILPYLDERYCLKPEFIQLAFEPTSEIFNCCETLLKGKEIILPDQAIYYDKDGNKRFKSRIKWWIDHADTLNELCLIPDGQQIRALNTIIDFKQDTYKEDKPIFFGHYWFTGQPQVLTEKLACVDYSAAIASGKLVAYRWQGEANLTDKHFIY